MTTRYARITALLAMTVTCGLGLGLAEATGARAAAQGARSIQAGAIADLELVRNGTFDREAAGWAVNPIGTHVGDGYGEYGTGRGMQLWPEFDDPYVGFAFQEIYLPEQITVATASVAYQFDPDPGAALDYFRVAIATETETLVTVLHVTADAYPGETWQSTGSLSFDTSALDAVNTARAGGQRVYVLLELRARSLRVNVDNVSLEVTGNQADPAWTGSIAFVGLDHDGFAKTVKRIDPDGQDAHTLWTHPQTGATNAVYDVTWRPDGGELAFASNHESLYSAFQSDAYGLQPDGTGLRRITNPPSRASLDTGGYELGTVTGRVVNNYGDVSSLLLYVQGARDAVSIDATGYHDEAAFTVPNVAHLGPGLHYVVFTWSGGASANCKEYAAAVVQVVPGQVVDAGTLQFGGTCGDYESRSITWKRDGSELGVDVITPRRFRAEGQSIGTEMFAAPLLSENPAWSPVDDRVLYYNGSYGEKGIYLTTVGGDRGTYLVNDQVSTWVTPAWLPDGSGLVYALDHDLYAYTLGASQPTPLAHFPGEYALDPSVSPDGRYVVFELWSGGTHHDLWILDRLQPVVLWQVTTDGRSTNPHWSKVDPQAGSTATTPATATGTWTVTVAASATATGVPSAVPTQITPPTSAASPSAATTPADTPDTPSATPVISATPSPNGTTAATASVTPSPAPAGLSYIFLPVLSCTYIDTGRRQGRDT